MKYEGKHKNGQDTEVYVFTVVKEELEVLLRLAQKAHEHSVKTIETMRHHGRLRVITKTLGKVWLEEVQGKKLPTKRTHKVHQKIRDSITPV